MVLAAQAAGGATAAGFYLVHKEHHSPPFVSHFDGHPKPLAHFLAYMECNRALYPNDAARIDAIAINLEKDTSEWLVLIHNEDAP